MLLTAFAAAVCTLIAVLLLPTSTRHRAAPYLLVVAATCVLVVAHRARRLQNWQLAPYPVLLQEPPAGHVTRAARAHGGPCDGQGFDVGPHARRPEVVRLLDPRGLDQPYRLARRRGRPRQAPDGTLIYHPADRP